MKKIKHLIFKWLWIDIETIWKQHENQIKNYKERIKYMEWEIFKLRTENLNLTYKKTKSGEN